MFEMRTIQPSILVLNCYGHFLELMKSHRNRDVLMQMSPNKYCLSHQQFQNKNIIQSTITLGQIIVFVFIYDKSFKSYHTPQQLTTTSNKEQSNPDGLAVEEETLVEAVSREEKTEEPALGSTSAVLENVPQVKGKEFMELLVLNICKNFKSPLTTQPEFSLEMLSDTCSIVVTFSSAKGLLYSV